MSSAALAGCQCSMQAWSRLSYVSELSLFRTTTLEDRPWRVAFRAALAFPSAVDGPRERAPLRREASICFLVRILKNRITLRLQATASKCFSFNGIRLVNAIRRYPGITR